MDYYISGKPAWRSESRRYPKKGEMGNPHLLHSVPLSLKRENQRCFQFTPFVNESMESIFTEAGRDSTGMREKSSGKSPLCFPWETPGIETSEMGSVDYKPKLWFSCWDQSLVLSPCFTACAHVTENGDVLSKSCFSGLRGKWQRNGRQRAQCH